MFQYTLQDKIYGKTERVKRDIVRTNETDPWQSRLVLDLRANPQSGICPVCVQRLPSEDPQSGLRYQDLNKT